MSFWVKNPTLKLFRKTIPVNLSSFISATSCRETSADEEDDDIRDGHEDCPSHRNPEPTTSSSVWEISRKRSVEREASVERETSTEERTLKKPDKLLSCPRCNSKRTKLCYFNNYNVSQPRHFCKSCQRYWTAGGTIRSVPVGAGRRKNKNSPVFPYPRILVSVRGSNPPEKETKVSNQEQTGEKFEPFLHQFQPPFPVWYHTFPFWGSTGPSSRVLPSSWTNSTALMPKSLRNDDLDEAEKSFINGGMLLNGSESKKDEERHVQMSPFLLQANPAAFSRSVKFHEILR